MPLSYRKLCNLHIWNFITFTAIRIYESLYPIINQPVTDVLFIVLQKFSAVRKEDSGQYYCRAKNVAGVAECSPQMMEVCKSLPYQIKTLPLSSRPNYIVISVTQAHILLHLSHNAIKPSCCFSLASFSRWPERCWHRSGCAGGSAGAVVYNRGHLLRTQERFLCHRKTDGKQVSDKGREPFLLIWSRFTGTSRSCLLLFDSPF